MKTKLKILTLCAATLWSLPSFAATYPITVTDVAGRTITFNQPPQNIALSTSRIFPLLEIIYQQDAAKHLVAARNDMQVSAPSMYANYIKHYPSLKNVAKIGLIKSGNLMLKDLSI